MTYSTIIKKETLDAYRNWQEKAEKYGERNLLTNQAYLEFYKSCEEDNKSPVWVINNTK